MGQSQSGQSHSLQSITDQPPPSLPTGSGERKISFVLNDNESSEGAEHKVHTPMSAVSPK